MEDKKIIDLFWQRNELAIAEVDKKYSKYCFKIAWNILSNFEDSEECVNDTWFSAWKRIPPTRPSILSAFLGKITRDFAIDCFRKKKAAKCIDTHMVDIEGEVEKLNLFLADGPEKHLEMKGIVVCINCFLKALLMEERDIFVRRYWYLDSIDNIAIRHKCSESRIKSKLFRIRKKLLKKLEIEVGYVR